MRVFLLAHLYASLPQDLGGVLSARAFVGWYNGLPEHAHVSNSEGLKEYDCSRVKLIRIVQGVKGSRIVQGVKGSRIVQGVKGSRIVQGVKGSRIVQGVKGSRIVQGVKGSRIVQGVKGSRIVQGVKGSRIVRVISQETGPPLNHHLLISLLNFPYTFSLSNHTYPKLFGL